MAWINENWLWLLLIGGMLAMHLFGHKGHGAGGGGGCCGGGGHGKGHDHGKGRKADTPGTQATLPPGSADEKAR